jgi:hypothetical protein
MCKSLSLTILPIVRRDISFKPPGGKLVEQALSHDEPVLVSLLVLLESEWVLVVAIDSIVRPY